MKTKPKKLKASDFPTIGLEYEYLGQPVTVTRVVPCDGGKPEDAHVEFETRFADRSSCDAGELSEREKDDSPLDDAQVRRCMAAMLVAMKDSPSEQEAMLIRLQMIDVTTDIPDHADYDDSGEFADWGGCYCDECRSNA